MVEHSGILGRLAHDAAGNTLAIAAAALVPLTAMAGGALDMSIAYMARAKLQNACDAAVLAGRQTMEGNVWTSADEAEADRYFVFNFPAGTHDSRNVEFTITQNDDDTSELLGFASATVPTSLMRIFGKQTIDIAVSCDAKRDQGHNDVMLVLDTTGSMANKPTSGGTKTKIQRLRDGASGLYNALAGSATSRTRFGFMPYSHTVNVARSLSNTDILVDQEYVGTRYDREVCTGSGKKKTCSWVAQPQTYTPSSGDTYRSYRGTKVININQSSWASGTNQTTNLTRYRTSGSGCIEERPSVGNAASPIAIQNTITAADINTLASSNTGNNALKYGRYDPAVQEYESQSGCPSEAKRFAEYATLNAYQTAVNAVTASVTGGTYHDVGMLWGLRFLSRDGYFADDNITEIDDVPVRQHIVFMTDGMLDTGPTLYSLHGIEDYQSRTKGSGSQDAKHIARFHAACNLAKSMGVTIWVIALDVGSTDDIDDCATSASHFYTSDGSDLQSVFERIGQGIGNLRLTR
jgi:Flp pilus assembly protein TadG